MNNNRTRSDLHHKTKHHIIPSSRIYMGITGVCKVEKFLHEMYHNLFGNMKPDEILAWLNKTFWNDMFTITIKSK